MLAGINQRTNSKPNLNVEPLSGKQHLQTIKLQAIKPHAQITFQGTGTKNTMSNLVESRQDGPVRYLSMNRHDRKNSLNFELFRALSKAFTEAEKDPNTKTIVLESTLDSYFSTGADLKSILISAQQVKTDLKEKFGFLPKVVLNPLIMLAQYQHIRGFCIEGHEFVTQVARSKKPTVAVVEGNAIGGGVEIALACDYIVASHNAKFAVPEVKYKIFPDWGAAERLPQRVGRTMAKFIILEGGLMADKQMEGPATLTAEEAERVGMIDMAVDSSKLKKTLKEGLESGRFSEKMRRPTTDKEFSHLEKAVRDRLKTSDTEPRSRLLAKFDRYDIATIDELFDNELKGLSPQAVEISLRRINDAPFVGGFKHPLGARLQHELDLVQLIKMFSPSSSK